MNKLSKLDCLSKIFLCVHYKKENFKRYIKDKKLHNKVFISYEKNSPWVLQALLKIWF